FNAIKGINKIKLTTAAPLSEEVKNEILSKIRLQTTIEKIELESVVNEDLIGGFVLEYNNNLVDASIQRELRDLRKQFDQNMFVQQIR
ncbi:MAG: F0F1 ATP synthase subunit delta, partial [Bacteroidota bacterium]|nr:F0F1 ATP synthase subunit delta [Bacteroidota bacterium]